MMRYFCDKCGKEIKYKEDSNDCYYRIILTRHNTMNINDESYFRENNNYILCDECFLEIENCLKEE